MDLNSVNITATQVAKNYFSAYVENGFIYSYLLLDRCGNAVFF